MVHVLERFRHPVGWRRRVVLNCEVKTFNLCDVVGHVGLAGFLLFFRLYQPPEGLFDLDDFRAWTAEDPVEILVCVSGYVDDVVPKGIEELGA
jgi:hypothetical protein